MKFHSFLLASVTAFLLGAIFTSPFFAQANEQISARDINTNNHYEMVIVESLARDWTNKYISAAYRPPQNSQYVLSPATGEGQTDTARIRYHGPGGMTVTISQSLYVFVVQLENVGKKWKNLPVNELEKLISNLFIDAKEPIVRMTADRGLWIGGDGASVGSKQPAVLWLRFLSYRQDDEGLVLWTLKTDREHPQRDPGFTVGANRGWSRKLQGLKTGSQESVNDSVLPQLIYTEKVVAPAKFPAEAFPVYARYRPPTKLLPIFVSNPDTGVGAWQIRYVPDDDNESKATTSVSICTGPSSSEVKVEEWTYLPSPYPGLPSRNGFAAIKDPRPTGQSFRLEDLEFLVKRLFPVSRNLRVEPNSHFGAALSGTVEVAKDNARKAVKGLVWRHEPYTVIFSVPKN